MLIVLLRWIFVSAMKLIIPPPPPLVIEPIPVNSPCPACGHSDGKLLCVIGDSTDGQQMAPTYKVLVQRTCLTCGSRSFVNPILDGIGAVHPAEPDFIVKQTEAYQCADKYIPSSSRA